MSSRVKTVLEDAKDALNQLPEFDVPAYLVEAITEAIDLLKQANQEPNPKPRHCRCCQRVIDIGAYCDDCATMGMD